MVQLRATALGGHRSWRTVEYRPAQYSIHTMHPTTIDDVLLGIKIEVEEWCRVCCRSILLSFAFVCRENVFWGTRDTGDLVLVGQREEQGESDRQVQRAQAEIGAHSSQIAPMHQSRPPNRSLARAPKMPLFAPPDSRFLVETFLEISFCFFLSCCALRAACFLASAAFSAAFFA